MIQANICVWNGQNRIGATIASIHDYVDRIVVCDGRYEGFFPNEPVESTDYSYEIATSFPKVEWIQCKEAMRPCEKRMLMFNYPDVDWFLIIDGDEIMYGPNMNTVFEHTLRDDKNPPNGYTVDCASSLQQLYLHRYYPFTRFIHKNAGFSYIQNHWMRCDSKGRNMDNYCPKLEGIRVIQLNELCGDARTQEKSRWVQWRATQGNEGW